MFKVAKPLKGRTSAKSNCKLQIPNRRVPNTKIAEERKKCHTGRDALEEEEEEA